VVSQGANFSKVLDRAVWGVFYLTMVVVQSLILAAEIK